MKLRCMASRMAILAGALGAMIGSLPDQPMKEQLADLASIMEADSDDMLDELEDRESSTVFAA